MRRMPARNPGHKESTTDMRLPPTLQAPYLARRAIEATLGESLSADALEVVKLLTSELVTNSVRYADVGPSSWIGLSIRGTLDAVRVGVSDPGLGFDPPVQPVARSRSLRQGGRGLGLVADLSTRWGTIRGARSETWFEVPRVQASSL